MSLGKEKIILLLAIIVLLVGTTSAVYVHEKQVGKDTITIHNNEYTLEEIFSIADEKTIKTDEGDKTGASLEDLMNKIGTGCNSCKKYMIIGSDGYSKTVEWNIFKTGVLTKGSRVFFPDTAHALWVQDVIEIEVK